MNVKCNADVVYGPSHGVSFVTQVALQCMYNVMRTLYMDRPSGSVVLLKGQAGSGSHGGGIDGLHFLFGSFLIRTFCAQLGQASSALSFCALADPPELVFLCPHGSPL